ncbi:efflux RND transporter permease subunit [Candidatus Kaiserbacteria bacterium]|nr:efflux RND transporter permease subunit [Candidatus Kaiserbacteria bacterium]
MNRETEINLLGRIGHFFVVNKPLSILLLATALIFGFVSFLSTPKQYNPEIVRPAFSIQINYQGATVDEAIDRVVYELAEKINTVPGVDDVFSEVNNGSEINTMVIFEVGYDAIKAKLDLLSQLEQHSYLARGNIESPQIIEINPETVPVLQLVFGAKDLSVSELRQKVIGVTHLLGGLEGVSEMSVHGGYQESLVVEVDVELLAEQKLMVSDIETLLKSSQTKSYSSGLQYGNNILPLVFDGRVNTPERIGLLNVNNEVQLREVAKIYEGTAGVRPYVFYHDKDRLGEVIMLSVSKVEGASAPDVTKIFLSTLDKNLTSSEFSSLEYKVVGDDGATASKEINGLTKNLLTSILIVALVLLLFLSVRAALVVLIAIPLTLLVVFGLGWFFDQTINRITLFALILSLGLLVDSAIVVVENIYSHLRTSAETKDDSEREKLIAKAVGEIGIGLMLSTLTSVIVFLPMNYITGMMGPYMGPIAFFVPAALIVSLLIAIVITPFVANHLVIEDEKTLGITKWFSRLLDKVTHRYKNFLGVVLYSRKKQKLILKGALGLFLVAVTLPLFGLVHFQMLPKADRDQVYLYLDLPIGTSLEKTKEVSAELGDLIVANTDVVSVQEFVGTPAILDFNGMFKGVQNRDGSQQATFRINLVASDDRVDSSSEFTSKLRAELKNGLPNVADYVRLIEEPPGPPVKATFVAKVFNENEEVRSAFAKNLTESMAGIAGVVDIDVEKDDSVGQLVVDYNEVSAGAYGVKVDQVESVVNLMSGPIEVGEYFKVEEVEHSPILISLANKDREMASDIDNLQIRNFDGEMVSVSSVVDFSYVERPSRQSFENSKAVTYVTAEVADRSIVYVVIELMKKLIAGGLSDYDAVDWNLFGIEFESDDGDRVSLKWGGEWEMTLENFRDLGIAMGVALALVYAVLVAQYNRFATPAFILVTVPLGLIGILFGFTILDNGWNVYLTATALIGFIALIGLVVNNAIIFLEYVEQAGKSGLDFRQSLLAAGEARLRPIFLTSLTTILGSLTIASDPVWSGLAWAIVFGLSLSTIMTLVIYPILLVYFDVSIGDN